jgi:hypothetical protein
MIKYTTAKTISDLQQIMNLQAANLPANISEEEFHKEGFVTVKHDLNILKEMNDVTPHTIAKNGEEIIGYTLSMNKVFQTRIPVLKPMFEQIDALSFEGNPLSGADYVIMGQVCIAKGYRGQGIFGGLYHEMKSRLSSKHPYIITEIDNLNKRSLKAHHKVGFEHLHEYHSDYEKHWIIVLWNWVSIS